MTNLDLMKCASATALAAVLAAAPAAAIAQTQQQTGSQAQQQGAAQSQQKSGQGGASGQAAQQNRQNQMQSGAQDEVLIATVGDAEIRGRQVREAISALPPQLRQQPPEMLVPMAIDQLVLRELILEKARAANLQDDKEVKSLAEPATEQAREQAMIQVWIDRQMSQRASEDKIKELYEGLKAANPNAQVPPMEQLRPQLEQQVRQQAFAEISNELQQDAQVTFYGPDGEPLEQPQADASSGGGSGSKKN